MNANVQQNPRQQCQHLPISWQFFFFLRDNELYHTAKWVKHYTEAQIIEIMKWLAQSHKLNPSQNHRKITGDKIIANKPSTHFAELWKRLEEEWSKFKPQNSENRFSDFLLISLKAVNIKKKSNFARRDCCLCIFHKIKAAVEWPWFLVHQHYRKNKWFMICSLYCYSCVYE